MEKNRQFFYFLLYFIICSLLHTNPVLADSELVTLSDGVASYDLSRIIEVLEDRDGQWHLDDIVSGTAADQFKSHQSAGALNFGITESAIWLRFRWHNPLNETRTFLLHAENPLIDELDVYFLDDKKQIKQVWQTGDARPFSNRANAQRSFVFELTLPPQQTGFVYIRIQAVNALYFPATLWHPNAFYVHLESSHIAWGIYFGIMLIIAFYNALLFISIRERTYLYYVLYIVSIIIFQAAVSGLFTFYFNDVSPWWVNRAPLLTNPLSICCASLFISSFLELHKYSPLANKLVKLIFLTGIGLMASVLLTNELHVIERWTQGFDAIAVFTAIAAAILTWHRGLRAARFFLLAWIVLLLGVLVSIFHSVGLLPSMWFTTYAVCIGSVLETVLLSFAMADRVNTLRQDKEASHEENMRLQKNFNQTLEAEVVERTQALELANKALEKLSNLDGLTQIYNRRFFDERLKQECQRLYWQKMPLSLVMCDIDHFKNFNDAYGHQAGDDCIKAVAEIIASSTKRIHDVPARYGGEEFAIILPQITSKEAYIVAERIKNELDKRALKHDHSLIKPTVSMSFGVASIMPDVDDDGKRLIALADKALYLSKDDGRDRITALEHAL